MIDPSGVGTRIRSVPSNAAFRNSMNCAAPPTMRYGVSTSIPAASNEPPWLARPLSPLLMPLCLRSWMLSFANRISMLLGILRLAIRTTDRKSTRLNSSHSQISYAVFCLKKKNKEHPHIKCISGLHHSSRDKCFRLLQQLIFHRNACDAISYPAPVCSHASNIMQASPHDS